MSIDVIIALSLLILMGLVFTVLSTLYYVKRNDSAASERHIIMALICIVGGIIIIALH